MTDKCVLCRVWDRLPYQARYSTPVEVREVEAVLITGYLLKSQLPSDVAAPLCEKHVQMLGLLDQELFQEAPSPGLAAQILAAPAQAGDFPGLVLPQARPPEPVAAPAGKVQFQCHDCGQTVTMGDVHVCPAV
jgi:hypothetical protein